MSSTTSTTCGFFNGASNTDASNSTFIDVGQITTITNVSNNDTVQIAVTHADVPQLLHKLIVADGSIEHDSRVSAAEHLVHIAQTADGPDHIITAVIEAEVVPQLVSYLSDSGALRQHVVTLLAYILRSQQTWNAALDTQTIRLLVACLSDPVLGTQVDAACALANITGAERGKQKAVDAGAIPPLVVALGRPSCKLKKMAARAVRNIASIDAGRKAAYASNAVQPLVALLDSRPLDNQVRYDAVKALSCIASLNKTARKAIRKQGAFEKLTGISTRNAPMEIQIVVAALRDKLR